MKKVIVLAAAIALLAAPAFAGIRNTKHDLSASNGNAGYLGQAAGGIDEICVFCHTPHGGQTGGNAPLWNRSGATPDMSAIALTNFYNSATVETATAEATVRPAIAASDAPLCLSCHDGATTYQAALTNAPNAGTSDWTGSGNMSAIAQISQDLSNDHPIGMDYSAVDTSDSSGAAFNNESGTAPNLKVGGLSLYGSTGVMWCSSCHDVHDNSKGTPFLATSNAGSALCLTCHIK